MNTTTPSYRLINSQKHSSFVIKEEPFDLNTRWHYHPEVELMYFMQGKVSGIMGNRFCEFNEGELLLLGSNFPHVIFDDHQHDHTSSSPFGVVIQFKEDFLGDCFFLAPELKALKILLIKSKSGILFKKEYSEQVNSLLTGISQRKSSRQLLDLLEILNTLAEIEDYEFLTIHNQFNQSELDEERMHVIKKYAYENFKRNIQMAEIAALVNLTETSFCRYYKSRTLKSFTQTLNEIRISYACELLSKDRSIADVCYESGYSNPAYFSRTFKKIVGMSPSAYKTSSELKIVRW